jgi:hypothetical protein
MTVFESLAQAFPRAACSAISSLVLLATACGGSATTGNQAPADEASTGAVDAGADATGDGSMDASADTGVDASADVTTGPDGAGACSASTCAAGCCTGTRCLSGSAPTACGQGGAACDDCTSFGAICETDGGAGGVCRLPAPCGPANCPTGCCDTGGVCWPGSAAAACGVDGTVCQTCSAGAQCSHGQCVFLGDAAVCNPQTCPNGCCDLSGTCMPGLAPTHCGLGGVYCQNCSLLDQQVCSDGQCVAELGGGGCAQTCPLGCCDALGQCHPGSSDTMCGAASCQDCTTTGEQCSSQSCGPPPDGGACNVETCPSGCCDQFGNCLQGITSTVCGSLGIFCQNCLLANQLCSTQQQCTSALPDGGNPCNAFTCHGCCDSSGTCHNSFADTNCGVGAGPCIDCLALGDQCASGQCVAPDGGLLCSQSCAGCCDATGNCRPGFDGAECGEKGAACQDCTVIDPQSVCDLNGSPRGCAKQQTPCPLIVSTPYTTCPAALEEPSPTTEDVCSTAELQTAGETCSDGADSEGCLGFFNFEFGSNQACFYCLNQFDYDFSRQTGIRTCAAPFVDAACNHSSGCTVDCVTQSCYGCPDYPSTDECGAQVQSGVCALFFQADPCVTQALEGAAALCNPATYQENFGAWLQAVGTEYCGH